MMNDNASLTAPEKAELRALDAIAALVTLLSDPVAAGARVKALQDALAEHRTVVEAAQNETAALAVARQRHLDVMADERTAHDAKLKSDRVAYDNECAAMRSQLTAAQEAAKVAKAEADAARDRSTVLNNDLETRLSVIHGAATAPLPARH